MDVASYNQDTKSEHSVPFESQRDCGDCCHHTHVMNAVPVVAPAAYACAERPYSQSDDLKISVTYGLERPPRTFA